ncbi:MAG: RloB domain-containing protein, partial [Bacteroidetes bacterium]
MSQLAPASQGTKPIKYGILIVCEDTKSSYYYLNDKVKSCKPKSSSTKVIPDFDLKNSGDAGGKTQTKELVIFAINKANELNLIDNNNGTESKEIYWREVYVVGDVDDNEYNNGQHIRGITNAMNELQTAQAANPIIKYKLLLSNECFEIWYILHFQDIMEKLYRGTHEQENITKVVRPDHTNRIKDVLKNVTGVSFNKQKSSSEFF